MEDNHLSEEDHNKQVIQEQLAEFLTLENAVKSFLEEVLKLKIRNQNTEVREEIRNFANANEHAFRFLANTINQTDGYFETIEQILDDDIIDPEEQFPKEELLEELKEIGSDYSALGPSVNVVYLEQFHDRFNPITTYDAYPGYSQSMSEPMVTYQAKSGEMPILETRNSVGIMLYVAWTMIGSATNATEMMMMDEERDINPEEVERMSDALGKIQQELAELEEFVAQFQQQ